MSLRSPRDCYAAAASPSARVQQDAYAGQGGSSAAGAFDAANSTPDSVLDGCLFNSDAGCRQLLYASGFNSVHKVQVGSFPAPVLITVRGVTSGRWSSAIVAFFPAD